MDRSFYQFVCSYRGGEKHDPYSLFADSMFNDLSFPKYERSFDTLSRYIEEKADPSMPSVLFDELYRHFEDRFL
ncbi:YozE family protein [Sporosarcina sp. A2]|uniref:YozE family protein n=1 Tax=Sporosarcina sp. A2 TaxID=3393449 RepID=UPI003D79060D